MLYGLVSLLSSDYVIELICSLLGVSKSAFYAWKRGKSYTKNGQQEETKAKTKEIFESHRRRYGARRIKAELAEMGYKIGRYQIRSWMEEQDLVAIQPKSFVPKTTNSQHKMGRSPNLLLDNEGNRVGVSRPYEVLVGDITYIPLLNGDFLYLATFQDMYTRVVLGWELMENMTSNLVVNALQKAIDRRKLPKGMIVHTDGGGQYASHHFRKLLAAQQFKQSMTRKDNHYDNAMGESFFSRSKAEMLQNGAFAHYKDAYTEIFEYIELYYNKKRRHSGIKYDFPERFEKNWVDTHNLS